MSGYNRIDQDGRSMCLSDEAVKELREIVSAPVIQEAVESYDYVRQREYMCSLERERANLWGVNEELRLKIASLEAGTLDLQEMLNALRSPLEVKAEQPAVHSDDDKQMLLPILGKCQFCLRSSPFHGLYVRPSTINIGRYESVRCPAWKDES